MLLGVRVSGMKCEMVLFIEIVVYIYLESILFAQLLFKHLKCVMGNNF